MLDHLCTTTQNHDEDTECQDERKATRCSPMSEYLVDLEYTHPALQNCLLLRDASKEHDFPKDCNIATGYFYDNKRRF